MNKDFSISFSNQDKVILDNFKNIVKKLFGIKVGERKLNRQNENYQEIYFISKFVRKLLFNFGLTYTTAEYKEIPEGILKSPKKVQANFIKGLFDTDGSISKYIRYVSASKTLIQQVQLVLLNFNIVSHITKQFNDKYQKYYYTLSIFSDNINIYKKEIGFDIPYKKQKLNNIKPKLNTNTDFVYNISNILSKLKKDIVNKKQGKLNQGWYRKEYQHIAKAYMQAIKKDRVTYYTLNKILAYIENCYEKENYNTHEYLMLKEFQKHKYFFTEIIETNNKNVQLYDIEVPTTHNFISNGIISHNSQGSSFNHVILYDDHITSNMYNFRNRWLYTAITRAEKKLTWITEY